MTDVNPVVEQGGIDFTRCLVLKPFTVQQVEHRGLLLGAERTPRGRRWFRPGHGNHRFLQAIERAAYHTERSARFDQRDVCSQFVHSGETVVSSSACGVGSPNNCESFFWTSMIVSAR